VDGRTPWARRFRDLIDTHLTDLGGETEVSAAERSLLRRAAALTVELELLEYRFPKGDGAARPEDLDLYSRMTNTVRRIFEATGLHRRARDVTPDLHSYLSDESEHVGAELVREEA
jgi:hypothetical protein